MFKLNPEALAKVVHNSGRIATALEGIRDELVKMNESANGGKVHTTLLDFVPNDQAV